MACTRLESHGLPAALHTLSAHPILSALQKDWLRHVHQARLLHHPGLAKSMETEYT